MATIAETNNLLDEMLSAHQKELLDELKGAVFEKFEEDIEEVWEQAAVNRLAIECLEQGDFGKGQYMDEHEDGHHKMTFPQWKPKFHKLEFPIFDGFEDAVGREGPDEIHFP